MKKKKKPQGTFGFESAEDIEDLMGMNGDELVEVGRELSKEEQHSQAESLAKSLLKSSPEEQALALKKLRREDILLFETVEYLMQRMKKR
ncbi:MAG: hypothetical protein H7249_08250 [Chitinophagaceae bacterium]|nr:hypothetical protein [Oligoflexus sp.]